MYDIFIVSSQQKFFNLPSIKKRFPFVKTASSIIEAKNKSLTNMFWVVWENLEILDTFDFLFDVPDWDKQYAHVFKNLEENNDGVWLVPKQLEITKKENEFNFILNKKEIDIIASKATANKSYDKFSISSYDDYLKALEESTTEMFWGIWPELEVIDESVFDTYFKYESVYDYDRMENHVWLTACHDTTDYRNGLVLFSKHKPVTGREIHYRMLINRKEHDSVVTRMRYPRFYISSYEDYQEALEKSTQPLFWCVWSELKVIDESVFDIYFDPYNGMYDYDRAMNHVFKNKDIEEEKFNGIMLMSKKKPVPRREIEFRFLVDKKEHDIVATKLKPYDIVFISYNEPNADANYQRLLDKCAENKVYRVHGVKGIHQAHLEAAKLATTPMFWVVDGDAIVEDNFTFDHLVPRYDRYIVHVWHSKNPINGLEYGYGGVKLLPKKQTLAMNLNSADMTSSISTSLRVMKTVSNVTDFNTDPFSTWRSAFRECAKLSSKVIMGQVDEETEHRLSVWCQLIDNVPYGQYAYLGAVAGKDYGEKNASDLLALNKINDFDWLKDQFEVSVSTKGNISEITLAQATATS